MDWHKIRYFKIQCFDTEVTNLHSFEGAAL